MRLGSTWKGKKERRKEYILLTTLPQQILDKLCQTKKELTINKQQLY